MKPFREWKLYEHERQALDLLTYELTVPRREVLFAVYADLVRSHRKRLGRREFVKYVVGERDVSALVRSLRKLRYIRFGGHSAQMPLQITLKGMAALWRAQ